MKHDDYATDSKHSPTMGIAFPLLTHYYTPIDPKQYWVTPWRTLSLRINHSATHPPTILLYFLHAFITEIGPIILITRKNRYINVEQPTNSSWTAINNVIHFLDLWMNIGSEMYLNSTTYVKNNTPTSRNAHETLTVISNIIFNPIIHTNHYKRMHHWLGMRCAKPSINDTVTKLIILCATVNLSHSPLNNSETKRHLMKKTKKRLA